MKSYLFRQDIQVLRGLAVFLVFLNHFIPTFFKNAFIGVDIFFVISGYVVASSSLERLNVGSFDFKSFVQRRILRIYPTLLLVTTISLFFYSAFTFTSGSAARAALTSIFSFSNFYFYSTSSDYYASTSVLQPFLHTWSLGVEFQFYLLFPFVFPLVFPWSLRRHFVCLLSLLSFSLLISQSDFNAFFYLPFSRIWQFYLGIIAFKFSNLRLIITRFNLKPYIFVCLLIFSSLPGHYPILGPLIASLLTFFFLVNHQRFLFFPRRLSFLTFSFSKVGLFSYSLYLWHWPFISITAVTLGSSITSYVLAFCLTLLFSFLSFNFLESKSSILFISLRSSFIYKVLSAWIFFSPLLFASTALFLKAKLIPHRITSQYKGTSPGYADFQECSDIEISSLPPRCVLNFNDAAFSRNIYVLGDSHSTHLGPAFFLHSLRSNDKIFMSGQSGIPFPPLLLSRNPIRPSDSEISLYRKQKSNLTYMRNNLSAGDIVIISNFTQRYFGTLTPLNIILDFSSFDPISGSRLEPISSYKNWISLFEQFVNNSLSQGAKIVYILPTPELNNSYTLPQQCYSYFPLFQTPKSGCTFSVNLFRKSYDHIIRDLFLLKAKYSNLFIYDPLDFMCSETCSILDPQTNKLFLYDLDHLSKYGSEFLYPSLSQFLQRI